MSLHVSIDLSLEWRRACLVALGLNPYDDALKIEESKSEPASNNKDKEEDSSSWTLVNLLPDQEIQQTNEQHKSSNPWMMAVTEIQSNMERMVQWIHEKSADYISVEMPDDEAFLIQSTVTSYTATTANEIESLRSMIPSNSSQQQQQLHQQTMVQILMDRLQEMAQTFGQWQKQRHRQAVTLWQNPLQCHLLVSSSTKSDALDQVLGLEDDIHQARTISDNPRFCPNRPRHALQSNYLDSYQRDETIRVPLRPTSLFHKRSLEDDASISETNNNKRLKSDTRHQSSTTRSETKQSKDDFGKLPYQQQEDEFTVHYSTGVDQLQQEAALLTAKAESDLDAVQLMEQRMVDITTLLSQFSQLVSEQQEDVWEIHDATTATKDNIDQGQEQLVDATQRTRQSQHYMAKAIFGMGILLLLFHWIRP